MIALLALAPTAALAAPTPVPVLDPAQTVIAGPAAHLLSLGGLSVSHDGSGAAVYLADPAGVRHVFVARFHDGVFAPGRELGGHLPGAASHPVVAAGEHGTVLVAFVQGGRLYVADTTRSGARLGRPRRFARHASDPTLALSRTGEGYLAFTVHGRRADTVRFDHWHRGRWSEAAGSANGRGVAGAGTGAGRPVVAAPNDGIGVLAWGQRGHIWIRRLLGARPSRESQRADPASVDGGTETAASDPVLSDVGFSTYASLAFDEHLQTPAGPVTHVVYRRLDAGRLDAAQVLDGTAAGAGGSADGPSVGVTEFGFGLVTSQMTATHQLFAGLLGVNDAAQSEVRVDSLPDAADPHAAVAAAGVYATVIAWQQTPGITGPSEIRIRYAPDALSLGPEQVVSDPVAGPTDAGRGLAVAGDGAGEAVIVWVQHSTVGAQLVDAELDQSPRPVVRVGHAAFQPSAHPTLAWKPAIDSFGPLTYTVSLDGAVIARTQATHLRVPAPLAAGAHPWQVVATDPAGLVSAPLQARVVVR